MKHGEGVCKQGIVPSHTQLGLRAIHVSALATALSTRNDWCVPSWRSALLAAFRLHCILSRCVASRCERRCGTLFKNLPQRCRGDAVTSLSCAACGALSDGVRGQPRSNTDTASCAAGKTGELIGGSSSVLRERPTSADSNSR